MIIAIKHLHITCALLTICGFILRSYWHLTDSSLARAKLTRVIPHLVDSTLLASALTLLWLYHWSPFTQPWLIAKIIALLTYIGFGLWAFRFAKSRKQKSLAIACALISVSYIVAVAITKSPTLNLI